jgi:hypothetical protein
MDSGSALVGVASMDGLDMGVDEGFDRRRRRPRAPRFRAAQEEAANSLVFSVKIVMVVSSIDGPPV